MNDEQKITYTLNMLASRKSDAKAWAHGLNHKYPNRLFYVAWVGTGYKVYENTNYSK